MTSDRSELGAGRDKLMHSYTAENSPASATRIDTSDMKDWGSGPLKKSLRELPRALGKT